MDEAELLRYLTAKKVALIEELAQLEDLIRATEAALRRKASPPPQPVVQSEPMPRTAAKPGRMTLAERREALRQYLVDNGPTSRAQILADTGIPPGTLSVLLTDPWFVSTEYGKWQIRDTRPDEVPSSME